MEERLEGEALKEGLRSFIETELLLGEGVCGEDTRLVAEGIIDSVSAVALTAYVEEEIGCPVGEDGPAADDLVDLAALTAWVERLRAGADGGVRGR